MSTPPHSFSDEVMKQFCDEYIATFPEKLKLMHQLIDEINKTVNKENLQALRFHIHKLAGSSGTYGFPELSILCREFEGKILQKMQELKNDNDKGDPRWIAEFMPYIEKIKKELIDGKQQ